MKVGSYIRLDGFIYNIVSDQYDRYELYCLKTQMFHYMPKNVVDEYVKNGTIEVCGRLAYVLYS